MKRYKLEVIENEGTLSVQSQNDGFTPFEVLGIFAFKSEDVMKQLRGEMKPDIIKREVVDNIE